MSQAQEESVVPGSEEPEAVERHVRQAVVVIHGMGEQRPLETLSEFIGAALVADGFGEE